MSYYLSMRFMVCGVLYIHSCTYAQATHGLLPIESL